MEPPTPPTNPADSSPDFPVEPTSKALENSPKEPALPTTKAPEGTQPEITTTAKDKTTEKGMHTTTEITTATSKSTTKETATPTEDKTTESIQVTSTTTKDTTAASKVTPKVMAATKKTTTEETVNTSKETTVSEDTAIKGMTPKPPKPTKAPQMSTSTKKPNTTPKVRKPKPTPSPPKTTPSTVPTVNPASSGEDVLQTTASPNHDPNSEAAEEKPENEDANAAGEQPRVILRPPALTPLLVPGTDIVVRGPGPDTGVHPMLSDETDLCNGKSVDGLTTLANGTLVAFRGHYFWMLNPQSPPSPPRRITEVWGIPSPIDTVFTRCNCEGKTFFFKDSQYWRFTNDVKDPGYPKQIVKGFGGLNGKIVAALSVPKYKERPESVYFFKRGGRIQQYTYRQEPTRKCTRSRPALHYPVYAETAQVRRRRFERAIELQPHTIRIHYSPPVRVVYQDKGFLHNEVQVSAMWRGLPNVVTSAISLPNVRRPDGYDYYAFSRGQPYNIDVPSRTARAITTRSGQTLSKAWYKCP
nr:hypothetical protein HJG59_014779 [Molossus molossus]